MRVLICDKLTNYETKSFVTHDIFYCWKRECSVSLARSNNGAHTSLHTPSNWCLIGTMRYTSTFHWSFTTKYVSFSWKSMTEMAIFLTWHHHTWLIIYCHTISLFTCILDMCFTSSISIHYTFASHSQSDCQSKKWWSFLVEHLFSRITEFYKSCEWYSEPCMKHLSWLRIGSLHLPSSDIFHHVWLFTFLVWHTGTRRNFCVSLTHHLAGNCCSHSFLNCSKRDDILSKKKCNDIVVDFHGLWCCLFFLGLLLSKRKPAILRGATHVVTNFFSPVPNYPPQYQTTGDDKRGSHIKKIVTLPRSICQAKK